MISNLQYLAEVAKRNQFGILAVNFDNYDTLHASLEAAKQSDSPLIVQCTEPVLEVIGARMLARIVNERASELQIPVALHLDHGTSFGIIKAACEAGFTSIMYDGSELSFSENIKNTRVARSITNDYGVCLEAELGHVGLYGEGDVSTDPDQIESFCSETDVDLIAVSIGTTHSATEGKITIDLELLKKLRSRVNVGFVLHGTSGLTKHDYQIAAKWGVVKFNLETQIRKIYFSELTRYLAEENHAIKPRALLAKIRSAITDEVNRRIASVGSELMGSRCFKETLSME